MYYGQEEQHLSVYEEISTRMLCFSIDFASPMISMEHSCATTHGARMNNFIGCMCTQRCTQVEQRIHHPIPTKRLISI
jgi:hypothetical protein